MGRIVTVAFALLLAAAPAVSLAADRECLRPAQVDAPSKAEPEPGPIKGKVEDGVWQKARSNEKSVEARTEKEVRTRVQERTRSPRSEKEIEIPWERR